MDDDKTLKIRAFPAEPAVAKPKPDNLGREQELTLELSKKNAQVEEEKKKALDALKIIERMRETLKQEQAKSAELQAKANAADAKVAAAESKANLAEAKATVAEAKAAEAQAKVKELTEALERISNVAASAIQPKAS